MALVPNNPFGDMSGQLGGMIFGKNQAGPNVRAVSKVTQPNSSSQINAKNAFSSLGGLWSSLSSECQQAWKTYSLNSYHPLIPNRSNKYSGYMAFRGCALAISSSNSHIVPISASWGSLGSFVNLLGVPKPLSYNVPLTSGSGRILDVPTVSYAMNFAPIEVYENNFYYAGINFIDCPVEGVAVAQLLNEFNTPFCFKIYISDTGKSVNFKPKHQYNLLLVSTGFLTLSDPDLHGSSRFIFRFMSNPNSSKSKYKLNRNSFVYVSLVAMDIYGNQKLCDSQCVVVQPPTTPILLPVTGLTLDVNYSIMPRPAAFAWNSYSGADSYSIYYSSSSDMSGALLLKDNISLTHFNTTIDSGSIIYYVALASVGGFLTPDSNIVSYIPPG